MREAKTARAGVVVRVTGKSEELVSPPRIASPVDITPIPGRCRKPPLLSSLEPPRYVEYVAAAPLPLSSTMKASFPPDTAEALKLWMALTTGKSMALVYPEM